MKAEIYYKEQYSLFIPCTVLGEKERVPMDHYHAGIVIKQGDSCLAKAVLYINPNMSYADKRIGLVGAYEAEENKVAVSMLFQAIEKLAKEQGLDYLIGPMNGSTWENYRFHDDSDKSLFFTGMKHRQYYPKQWKSVGFRPMANYLSTIAPIVPQQNNRLEQVKNRLLADGVRIRPINMDNYEAELKKLYPFLQESFQHNFLYSPISEASFLAKYLPMKPVLKSEFVQIAEYEGEVVGVLLGTEDLWNPKDKTIIVKTLARSPNRLCRGLGMVLVDEFYQRGLRDGYQQVIFAFMIEDGDATPLTDRYHGHTLKTYTLYGKAI